jgi:hypothetical protein
VLRNALLDLFEASGIKQFLTQARFAADWLTRLAVPAFEDANGLAWPSDEEEGAFAPMWCHGAAGIARFFIHAAQINVVENAMTVAEGAARSVARGARRAGPTQCHGLAGNIEVLIDFFQATGDPT